MDCCWFTALLVRRVDQPGNCEFNDKHIGQGQTLPGLEPPTHTVAVHLPSGPLSLCNYRTCPWGTQRNWAGAARRQNTNVMNVRANNKLVPGGQATVDNFIVDDIMATATAADASASVFCAFDFPGLSLVDRSSITLPASV